jgi:hypothetical protein
MMKIRARPTATAIVSDAERAGGITTEFRERPFDHKDKAQLVCPSERR